MELSQNLPFPASVSVGTDDKLARLARLPRLPRRDLLSGIATALMVGITGKSAEAKNDSKDEKSAEKKGKDNRFRSNGDHATGSQTILKAKHLVRGDTVGIVAPASPLENETEIEYTYQWLKKIGLKYKLGKHLFDSYSDFAGSDENRIADFNAMWADPEVKAVMPMRGGNGAARLLNGIDYDLIAKNPKIIVGYSDITSFLLAIHQRTGLVTFHGPMMGGFFEGSYTYHNYLKAVMSNKPIGLITDKEDKELWNPEGPPSRHIITGGKARGRLTGGCMTLIRQLMGTPYEIDTEGKILFLEDLDAEPHEIDRMLYQLHLAGKLQKAAGIIIGECTNCNPGGSGRNSFPLNFSLDRILEQRLSGLGIPVIYGLRFGHSKEKFTIPLGVMASLEASDSGVRFKIEENATL
ncbi:MAG: LD-carboxypeptidase [Candidatus Obscuribacterales bacterium]|nr:LD-carboxypeptidase [Candidatus Obscuribacterales bacterium]